MVCAGGFYLSISIPESAPYKEKFETWWKNWDAFLKGRIVIDEVINNLISQKIQFNPNQEYDVETCFANNAQENDESLKDCLKRFGSF